MVGFVINYEWDDMRELSKMPDVRLWFVLLDAMYPWLPVVLDWRAGELARYIAMLVPHEVVLITHFLMPTVAKRLICNLKLTYTKWKSILESVYCDFIANEEEREGLAFNPKALELLVMSKLFIVYPWLQTLEWQSLIPRCMTCYEFWVTRLMQSFSNF
ncbi:hypothetical protein GOP47_0011915 [Adiantum capillus-veneris]|uniref:Uncharacterized protein n=1 Tax=Adiantum capillus-veneris TaxID=13818 RepID=A0A9D4UUX0_ADICA|nr:hypothetical protein GOP47_0011915 [Adiantum capillus-veneris]